MEEEIVKYIKQQYDIIVFSINDNWFRIERLYLVQFDYRDEDLVNYKFLYYMDGVFYDGDDYSIDDMERIALIRSRKRKLEMLNNYGKE